MVQREETMIRKGPWTEQEDLQLMCSVGLFGDRRWDYIAKVSGSRGWRGMYKKTLLTLILLLLHDLTSLNRTGKSCRLRWVNYLHPDLKRGRMTPQEERLVLELHSRWGNRWSRIARKLPGRTDNEIKNYWRTHMRKKAQEMRKQTTTMMSSGSSSISTMVESSNKVQNTMEAEGSSSLLGKGSCSDLAAIGEISEEEEDYSMDQIWKEIASPEEVNSLPVFDKSHNKEEEYKFSCPPMASPVWDYCSDSIWKIDEEEIKMGGANHFIFNYDHRGES